VRRLRRRHPRPAAPVAGPAPAPAPAPAAAPAPAPAAASAAQAAGSVDIVVPDIGDFDEVAVIELLVKPGDTVKAEQSLITVESDKASMEIPSSAAGTVESLLVKVGDKVSKGTPIAKLKGAAGAAAPEAAAAPAAAAAPSPAPVASEETQAPDAPAAAASKSNPTAALPAHEPAVSKGNLPHASPSIRKLARELGVALGEVKGSGPKGRITEPDVQGYVKAVLAGEKTTAAQQSKGAAPGAAAAKSDGGGLGLIPWPKVGLREARSGRAQGALAGSRRSPAPTCTATGC
jgi:pyruvate dehydrogenase E2 component (dihydrolipoamide acetyltransferase)